MNTIIMNFDNDNDLNMAYKQLKKQYPKIDITKNTEKEKNPAIRAMREFQEEMKGEAERLGLHSEEECIKWIYEVRDEIRRENSL